MNLGDVFVISCWQTGIVVAFILVSLVIVFILNRKIKWSNLILSALAIGMIGGFIVFGLNQSTPKLDDEGGILWHSEAITWLNIFPSMFVSLMLLFVPFIVFVNIFISLTRKKISTKFFIKVVASFAFFVIIATVVAFALWPIWNQVSFDLTNDTTGDKDDTLVITIPGIIIGWVPSSINIFADAVLVMSCIIASIFFAVIVNVLGKHDHERAEGIVNGMTNLQTLVGTCLKYIVKLIPLVIICKLPGLFIKDVLANFESIAFYLLGFFIGIAIILAIVTVFEMLCKPKSVSQKDMFSNIQEPLTFAFFSQSSMATVPLSIKSLDKLGLDESISIIVPSMGASMGVVVCAAFYPVSIAIVTVQNMIEAGAGYGAATTLVSFILLLFIVTLISSFGVAGVPGTATAATTTVLGGVGLPFTFYTLILSLDPLVDMFRTMANVDTILANAMMQDKLHRSGNQTKKLADEIISEFEYNKRFMKPKIEENK